MAAPKGNKFALGAASGAPSKYQKARHCKIAARCARAGLTAVEIAEAIGISQVTLNRWMLAHDEFRLAVKVGKEAADDRMERSLYELGLSGHPTAQIFWLKNRRPAEWRDKQDIDISHDYRGKSDADILAAITKELGEAMASKLMAALEGKADDSKLLELVADQVDKPAGDVD